MKRDSGVTLTSLIVYVIAMVIVVATVSTLTSYFYGNIDRLSNKTDGAKEYTAFNSFFTSEINDRSNKVLTEVSSNTKLVFSSGNQYTFQNGMIYFNKIIICRNVTAPSNSEGKIFIYDDTKKQIGVNLEIAGQRYTNVYKLTNTN